MDRQSIAILLGGVLVVAGAVGVGVATAGPSPAEAWAEINDSILPALSAEADARAAADVAARALADVQARLAEAQAAAAEAQGLVASTKTAADAAEARLGELSGVVLPAEQAESGQMQAVRKYLEARHAGGTP